MVDWFIISNMINTLLSHSREAVSLSFNPVKGNEVDYLLKADKRPWTNRGENAWIVDR